MVNAMLKGKPDAGISHVAPTLRYVGEGRSDATRGFLPCKSMMFAIVATCAASLSAAALYTNKWTNTQGASVTNLYGNAANWSVAYEPGVSPPASAVPTGDSLTYIQQNATITLQDGDDYTLGTTYFLGSATHYLTLNLIIPTGAKLSLDGTSLTSYVNTWSWVDGGTRNRVTFDVNGGSLTLGQKIFSMRGNTQYAETDVPVSRVIVRNGGTMAVTNGYVRLWGGSSADSQGRGLYTNIIDVLEGSTLTLRNKGRIAFGSSHDDQDSHYDSPWTQLYYGGGWVNVKGGKILCKGSTTMYPIVMNGHANAGMGDYLNVTDAGTVDLGGQAIYIGSNHTAVPDRISVSGGGVITNGYLSVQGGNSGKNDFAIDINGGKVFFDEFRFGTSSGVNSGRVTVRVHGGDSTFDFKKWSFTNYGSVKPIFADMRLAPHTLRTADFAVRPIRTREPHYNCGGMTKTVYGYWRLSPDGGFQLVHKTQFELLARKHDNWETPYYIFGSNYGGLIGEDMWATNVVLKCETRWKGYVGYEYAYAFCASLKADAQLTDGVSLDEPKPRAWLQLPTFLPRQVNPDRMERVSVRLDLVAPEGGTLDLDKVVANMRDEGGQDAYADSSVSGYNVRVDLPIGELKANTTEDSVVMDFVKCSTYAEASGLTAMTTNALIRTATCEPVGRVRGMVIIFR